ncbi:MAG: right-handed parallel beta-helix repeat-containing protein [Thermoanaerobaculaceae bacterium]|nr:right-handed parallel beta-helix repeat-containing protein [Thermoanaerobaculaceae bacterium]
MRPPFGGRRALLVPLAALAATAAALTASAQATRTWVSGVGDDANPCSRTAPCKTFAGAISKTAAGGEIDALDPGGFGGVTITKAITLDGGGGQVASILVSGTNGINVNAGASDVVIIRNLRLDGLAGGTGAVGVNGIRFTTGKALHVEHCAIFGFGTAGIDFEPAAGGALAVSDTDVTGNPAPGIVVGSGSAIDLAVASLTRVRSSNNSVGVLAKEGSRVTITDSEASSNCFAGFYAAPATAAPAEMTIQRSRAAFNAYGVKADDANAPGTATVRISHMTVMENGAAGTDATGTGSIVSFGNNLVAANGAGSYAPNVAPGFDPIANQTLAVSAPAQNLDVTNVTPTATGPLEAGQSVRLTATSDAPGLVPDPTVSGSGATLTLAYQPVANLTGVATITVTADDGQCIDHAFSRTFLVAVGAPNVAPTFVPGPNLTVPASSGPAAFPGWATGISPGPPSESWQTVAFVVTPANAALFAVPPAIAPDGTLTFTPQPGAVGQSPVTVVLHDDGGTAGGGADTSATRTFIIAVGQDVQLGIPALSPLGLAALAVLLAAAGLAALHRANAAL